jgi:hypothetical protein
MTFNVSCPNFCDLESKPNEMWEFGERCLKLWGIVALLPRQSEHEECPVEAIKRSVE